MEIVTKIKVVTLSATILFSLSSMATTAKSEVYFKLTKINSNQVTPSVLNDNGCTLFQELMGWCSKH